MPESSLSGLALTQFPLSRWDPLGRATNYARFPISHVAPARSSSHIASLMRTVLFLCTGNYYRSRFAEELFNHHALRAGLGWVARSRALAIEYGVNNVGPLSPFVLKALEDRGLIAKDGKRFPQRCALIDLESADLIVALMESEHRPLIRERCCGWENRVDYWQVGDVKVTQPGVALRSIETEIAALIEKLRAFSN